jgi:hypothetical protein
MEVGAGRASLRAIGGGAFDPSMTSVGARPAATHGESPARAAQLLTRLATRGAMLEGGLGFEPKMRGTEGRGLGLEVSERRQPWP